MHYFANLCNRLRERSHVKQWPDLLTKWTLVRRRQLDSPGGSCLCGKQGLVHLYHMQWEHDPTVEVVVGSKCIEQFNSAVHTHALRNLQRTFDCVVCQVTKHNADAHEYGICNECRETSKKCPGVCGKWFSCRRLVLALGPLVLRRHRHLWCRRL